MNRLEYLEKENAVLSIHKSELIEKVWALESKINRWASKQGELNVFLQQRSADGWGNNVVDVAMQHIRKLEHENKQLREELDTSEKHLMTVERHLRDFKKFEFEERTEKERLREALEFYADGKHYETDIMLEDNPCDVTNDGGLIARKALAGD